AGADALGSQCRPGRRRRRVHRAGLHAVAIADLCLDRRGVRGRHARWPGAASGSARRGLHHRRDRGRDHGRHRAIVGTAGVLFPAHARAAGAAGEDGMTRSFGLILAAGAGLAAVPWLGLPAFYESILYLILHWIALATSWNLLSG